MNAMNKKGITTQLVIALAFGLVIAVVGIMLGSAIIFSKEIMFYAVGITGIFITLIYMVKSKDLTSSKVAFSIAILVGFATFFIFLPAFGFISQTAFQPSSSVQIAVPHYASYKCDVVGQEIGIQRTIPSEGLLISQNDVGFYTNGITNININIQQSFFSDLVSSVRVRWQLCDVNGNNCGQSQSVQYTQVNGRQVLPIASVNLATNSLKVFFERRLFISWTPYNGAVISYDANRFGLTLASTTRDPAGSTICSTSCDLNCPSQGVRDKLVATEKNTLNFFETAPYLEYWDNLDYDLNAQNGAPVFSPQSNTFCLAGAVYDAGELTLENGKTFVYPETATRQIKQCCPGAIIRTLQEVKVCQSDYTFRTISSNTQLTCTSDLQCPGGGLTGVQKVNNSFFSSEWSCNGGQCVQSTLRRVQCASPNLGCDVDQTCDTRTFTCVGGSIVASPISTVNNQTLSEEACKVKTNKYPFLGYEYRVTTEQPSFGSKLAYYITFGAAGSTTAKTIPSCPATFLPYYTFIVCTIIIGLFLVVGIKLNKKKTKR